jgi:hypothetical protein
MAVLEPTDTLRCIRCRNLTGVANLDVTPGGFLICSTCARRRRIPSESSGTVVFIGPDREERSMAPLRGGPPADEGGPQGTGHGP